MPARYSAGMIDRRHFIALAALPSPDSVPNRLRQPA